MKAYPSWVMSIALGMICAGILPMPLVYLLRRFQILQVDLDIHQGSIRRNETTASTKEMIDQDDDVSAKLLILTHHKKLIFIIKLIQAVTQVVLETLFLAVVEFGSIDKNKSHKIISNLILFLSQMSLLRTRI